MPWTTTISRTDKSELAHLLAELGPISQPTPAPQTPPLSKSPALWSAQVIAATKIAFTKPHSGPNNELRAAYEQVRAYFISCVNALDTQSSERDLGVPSPCPTSCLGVPTPRLVVQPADKSIMTDPLPEPMAHDSPIPCLVSANPVPRTYASVAVGTPATSDRKPFDSKPTLKTLSRPKAPALAVPAQKPVRLIVRPPADHPRGEMPFACLLVRGPSEPFRLLSHALSLPPRTKYTKLLGVHQNRSGNLVVSLPPGTPDATVAAIIPIIHNTLQPPSFKTPPVVDRDTLWSKLLVSSVPARPEPGAPTYPEADVLASFLQLNSSVSALKITRSPRWIRNPASITGAHSSFTFSFEDRDGSLARSLAKSSLFVFGTPVYLKRWTDKTRQQRKETQRTHT